MAASVLTLCSQGGRLMRCRRSPLFGVPRPAFQRQPERWCGTGDAGGDGWLREPFKILDAMLAYSDNERSAPRSSGIQCRVSRSQPERRWGRHRRSGDSVQRQLNQRLCALARTVSPNRRAQL